jgi:hypothetical protein
MVQFVTGTQYFRISGKNVGQKQPIRIQSESNVQLLLVK